MSRDRQLAGEAAIVGAALAVSHGGEKRTPLQLHTQAARAALREAGVDRSAVGAVFTASPPLAQPHPQFNLLVLDQLKVAPRYTAQVGGSCAGVLGAMQLAASLVATGLVDYAVCSAGDSNEWSAADRMETVAMSVADPLFELPYGVSAPAIYAQLASRYVHEHGITPEQAARVAVENRRWGLDHPTAMLRHKGPLTVDDVLASPVVASPLRVYDCAPWYPGGVAGAVVITRSLVAAREHDAPVYLRGFGQTTTHGYVSERMGLDDVAPYLEEPAITRTGVGPAAAQAYAMSGLSAADVDVVESSAPFTYFLLRVLEELGFCDDGEAGVFVEKGGIDRDAGLAFNTYGGMLTFGQIGQAYYPAIEAIDQLRGRAGPRQLPGAHVGIVHAHGGPLSSQSVMLLAGGPGER